MPYIKSFAREHLDIKSVPDTAGELNYLFTRIAVEYLDMKGEGYQAFNDILGALEGCKLELYRRKVAPYEDVKIEENGDVY